jgi:hypothetical protein
MALLQVPVIFDLAAHDGRRLGSCLSLRPDANGLCRQCASASAQSFTHSLRCSDFGCVSFLTPLGEILLDSRH